MSNLRVSQYVSNLRVSQYVSNLRVSHEETLARTVDCRKLQLARRLASFRRHLSVKSYLLEAYQKNLTWRISKYV